ncbi:hypothetical protein M422DRAFT_186191 [Sphaerobolus stellatus SS14]|uniref:Spermidine synthase n=1 Tax=Sphaerobolus stellatus (strain SS14) TaxID=990650 RepID=A0A0C9V1B1_SPHS4|nr:hypothetical protein M422DRAFT_186191 [Sphaerobolus stellatus SS14]
MRGLPFCVPIITAALVLSLPPSSSPALPYVRGSASSRGLKPEYPVSVRVLDRAHSLTGLILVGEHVDEGFRFMRADHSLLGGRWINRIPPDSNGLGDSIYSTFLLQEAVRFAHRGDVTVLTVVSGLGVGIAAQAFIAHGINTTVVEIDPVVYKYAREYFGLPEPQAVHLEDARQWVHDHTEASPNDTFDYVIHDCFSGGGVPQHIFTVEFWDELKSIMKPNGVLAVNFAGKIATDPARAIYLTLQRSFDNCQAYHDHLDAEFDEMNPFFNVVFFCMADRNATLKFREATADDHLGSYLRKHVLNGLPKRGLEASKVLGDPELLASGTEKWILRDSNNRLAEWEAADAVEHWAVMRDVLPDIFWETY